MVSTKNFSLLFYGRRLLSSAIEERHILVRQLLLVFRIRLESSTRFNWHLNFRMTWGIVLLDGIRFSYLNFFRETAFSIVSPQIHIDSNIPRTSNLLLILLSVGGLFLLLLLLAFNTL